MRSAPFALFFIAVLSLTSCTKESLFPNPDSGTVLELGFQWYESVESCLDSDDHSRAFCGRATWLDGTRVSLDLPSPESVGFDTQDPIIQEIVESKSIRYVYLPATQSVQLYLNSGTVTLEWNAGLGCLEGDLFDRDYLSIWTSPASPSAGI